MAELKYQAQTHPQNNISLTNNSVPVFSTATNKEKTNAYHLIQ